MIKKIYDYIKQYNMFDDCSHLVVGLSGGADSVCLLRVLYEIVKREGLDMDITAVHVHHGIRGAEADRDEDFSKRLCDRLGVGYVCYKEDVPKLARDMGVTVEEAGRNLRYSLFEKNCKDGSKIAVAHHMDDQAETVLMNMFRGSGISGVCGIAPVRGDIIRPLLGVTRQEIEEYLRNIGQDYVTDGTNSDNEYMRNRVRNQLIPYVRDNINERAVMHITALADELRLYREYILTDVDRLIKEGVVYREDGASLQADIWCAAKPLVRSAAVHDVMKNIAVSCKDIYKVHVDKVLELFDMQVGRSVSLPYSMTAVRRYDGVDILMLKPDKEIQREDKQYRFDVELVRVAKDGVVVIPVDRRIYIDGSYRYVSRVRMEYAGDVTDIEHFLKIGKNCYTKCFDCATIKSTLSVRHRQNGDVIEVDSNGGHRKLKNEMIDRKVPKEVRDDVLLLTQGSEVLWAAGIRRCEGHYVEEASKEILMVTLEFQED